MYYSTLKIGLQTQTANYHCDYGMIHTIHISEFRSCIDVRLSNLTSVTALVGRNGAGKTNIMQAVEWLATLVSGVKGGVDYSDNGKISVEFTVSDKNYSYYVNRVSSYSFLSGKTTEDILFEESLSMVDSSGREELLVKRDGDNVYLAGSEEPLTISSSISAINWLTSFLPKSDKMRRPLIDVWHYFTRVIYYPLSDNAMADDLAFVVSDDYSKWLDGLSSWKCLTASDTIRNIIKMHLQNDDLGKFDEIQALLGPDHLDVISEIVIDTIPLRAARDGESGANVAYVISFKPSGHTNAFSFDRLSFGTKRVVQLVTSILSDSPYVSLMEQPEDGIHPALLYKIVPIVRAYMTDRQFIFASHSPAVLDAVSPEEVRLVEMANGRTYARSLSDVEIGAAHNYLAREGPLSSFIDSL